VEIIFRASYPTLGVHCTAVQCLPFQVGQGGIENWVEKVHSTFG